MLYNSHGMLVNVSPFREGECKFHEVRDCVFFFGIRKSSVLLVEGWEPEPDTEELLIDKEVKKISLS